jgi:penicillin-binding protein 2
MLILDELKKNDPQLRLFGVAMAAGLFVLLAGLWWVQVVSARAYQSHLETQSYRTVRLPAMRGKILDRNGRVLAENIASYNVSLYFEDLSSQFKSEYDRLRPVKITTNSAPFWKFWSRSRTVETNRARLKKSQVDALAWQARSNVVNDIIARVGQEIGQPLAFDAAKFERGYETRLALPYTVVPNASPQQVARVEEQGSAIQGVDVELQSARTYPLGTTAGHLLGYLRRDDDAQSGEPAYFNYYLPDYRGVVGIEGGFDTQLRGHAGEKSVLVNNLGYRQSESILDAPEPGNNVVLTIDLGIQRAAERSLLVHQGPDARAAIVVMDVHSGDVLAMVSSPAINPNDFVAGFSPADWQQLNDTNLNVQINRATQQNYAPGSIFKPVVALAALEAGLNPDATVDNPGYVMVGRRRIGDLAAQGHYNLRRAIIHSSNTYFITIGLRAGIENVIRMAEKFHFGERFGLPTQQETAGIFPTLSQVQSSGWHDGDSANICFGQGEMAVTPLQMAVAYSAIANGGTVLWPRLVERIEPQDPASGGRVTNFPSGIVRDRLGVNARNLKLLRDAMLGETEDPEGTGHAAVVSGMHICGKTGTAQVMNARNQETSRTTWFASFAPYENPRYAVVVMVEGGTYGGPTCGPIAHDIYEEILASEHPAAPKAATRN